MLKYIGNGTSLTFVPARDLNEDDLEQLKMSHDITKQDLLKSGLYEEVGSKPQFSKKASVSDEEK